MINLQSDYRTERYFCQYYLQNNINKHLNNRILLDHQIHRNLVEIKRKKRK